MQSFNSHRFQLKIYLYFLIISILIESILFCKDVQYFKNDTIPENTKKNKNFSFPFGNYGNEIKMLKLRFPWTGA